MSRHHSLDISPVPERVLFINETNIADVSSYDQSKDRTDQMGDDNVRIYVPLDLNQSAILRRLKLIRYRLGTPTEANESEYEQELGQIIIQLEIYDQLWCAREGNFSNEPDEHWHSRHAKELAEKILDEVEEWAENGNAECFPYDDIDTQETEYKITRDHGCK